MTALKRSEMRSGITHLALILWAGPQAVAAGLRALAATQVKHGGESTKVDNADIKLEQAVREQRVKYICGETRANPHAFETTSQQHNLQSF